MTLSFHVGRLGRAVPDLIRVIVRDERCDRHSAGDWQDPVNDVILIYSERQCSIYFACWEAASMQRTLSVSSHSSTHQTFTVPGGSIRPTAFQSTVITLTQIERFIRASVDFRIEKAVCISIAC